MHQTNYGTFEFELARRWAPVHWQEISAKDWRADLLTAIDFDGDWKTIGNWDAMTRHPLIPVVYYSVVESGTHWFVLYTFYHPRDWNALGVYADMHENDLEGFLAVIDKPMGADDVAPFGSLVGMVTIAHNHFYSYTNVLEANNETIDGPTFFARADLDGKMHPCTRQEYQGHGFYGLQPTDSRAWKKLGKPHEMDGAIAKKAFEFPHKKGVRYVPGEEAVAPTGFGPVTTHDCPYVLVDLFEEGGLWQRRCADPDEPFTDEGQLAGRKYEDDKASPPWAWHDKDHAASLGKGAIATDPIRLVREYFKGFVRYSPDYVRNPYLVPLDCDTSRFERLVAVDEGIGLESMTPAAGNSRRAIQRRLRDALDPAVREEVVIGLVQDAEASPRFERALIGAARTTLEDALAPRRRRRGPDASQRLHMSVPAIYVLGRFQDRASRPMLVQVLQASSDRDVLLATLSALGGLSPANESGFKAALVELLGHGDPDVRAAATELYSAVLARRDPRPLENLTADPNSSVRAAALEGLGRSGRRKYVGDLEEAASDHTESVQVRIAATAAIADRPARRRRTPRDRAGETDLETFFESAAFESAAAAITDTPRDPADYARLWVERLQRSK